MADIDALLDEYAARLARGEVPDVRSYLARAGAAGDELRELIDRLLVAAPATAPTEERVALMAAWAAGRPPLSELRRRRGRRVEAVVEEVMEMLGIDPEHRARVNGHYRRLEAGLLDLRRMDRRALEAVAGALHAGVADLAAWAVRPGGTAPAPASYTAASLRIAEESAADAAAGPPSGADEVDRLFGVEG